MDMNREGNMNEIYVIRMFKRGSLQKQRMHVIIYWAMFLVWIFAVPMC